MLLLGLVAYVALAAGFLIFNYASAVRNEQIDNASEEYFMMQVRPPPEGKGEMKFES